MGSNILKSNCDVACNVNLKDYTRICIGGEAKYLIEVYNTRDLVDTVQACIREPIKFKVIGEGTNIYFPEGGYDGIVVCNRSQYIESVNFFDGSGSNNYGFFIVGSGTNLPHFIRYVAELGFDCSKLYGIPGTVGGAVYGNAGAYGAEMKDFVCAVSVIQKNAQVKLLTSEHFKFTYRGSSFKDGDGCIIVSIIVRVPKGNVDSIKSNMDRVLSLRESKLPTDIPCAGSFFKNINLDGVKIPTGWLLDQVNAKEVSAGNMSIYSKHANVIVNPNKCGTSDEVIELCKILKQKVLDKYGIMLEEEVEFIN
jgi:UDP-N-acetylmuramate dehydrogenase